MSRQQKNIVKNIVDTEVQNFQHKRFQKEDIVNAVLLHPKISNELARRKKALPGWPDEEAYYCLVKELVTRRINRNIRLKLGGHWQNIREFWSVEKLPGGKRIYARITSLTPQEMRIAGNSYLHLGKKNIAKGRILLALADEVEQSGAQPTDDLLKKVAEELAQKGQI